MIDLYFSLFDQICAAFGPNQPQPHWDDVSYQLIKVDRTSKFRSYSSPFMFQCCSLLSGINSLCSMRLEYTQDKRKLEGSGATRHFVRLQWEMPDGVESMGPIYAKWGFARKTSTGFEDLEFQGRTEIKQISMVS